MSYTWTGPATSGYPILGNTGQGQSATWLPWSTVNPNVGVTQWGYIRLLALQAWNEFNWNSATIVTAGSFVVGTTYTISTVGTTNFTLIGAAYNILGTTFVASGAGSGTGTASCVSNTPSYKDFTSSFLTCRNFANYSNNQINTVTNSLTFQQGTFSNQNDLITGDLAGVSLSLQQFGQDLINLGKALNISQISKFGLPSTLLQLINQNNAQTSNLSLALLSVGLTASVVEAISNGSVTPTLAQEQKLYSAFSVVRSTALTQVLVPLSCKTAGLRSLADLLNVKSLFPLSYSTLTVPLYNTTPGPTNSKTYYLLFSQGQLSSQLTSPGVIAQVPPITPDGTPAISNSTTALGFQPPIGGFGSYLQGILPADQAVLAGAFSASMQQINNINKVDLQRFAQVVFSTETTANLPLISGTNLPTDTQLASTGLANIALGGGINGTYTMSNFFGCMSGLPYPLQEVQNGITQLQTVKLTNIYQQLYLACTWQGATATAIITGTVGSYALTGFTITNAGGGYSRGTAPAPTVTVTGSGGFLAIATVIIGTDPTNITTYGKVTGFTITNPGTQSSDPNPVVVQIQAPPTDALSVNSNGSIATGGTNTAYGTTGWTGAGTGLDLVVQIYVTQANTEIAYIATASTNNINAANTLNTNYSATGTALQQEQRARYAAIPPVPIPYNPTLNAYPTTLYTFGDSITSFAAETQPNMTVQTLENITDMTTVGGQSVTGAMRQARNQARLQQVGIPLTNNISNGLTSSQLANLMLSTSTSANQPVPPVPIASYDNCAPKYVNIPIVNGLAAANTIPILLNTAYTSSTISPSSYGVSDAINNVITCNCTCWVM